jgi:hypothetical protein
VALAPSHASAFIGLTEPTPTAPVADNSASSAEHVDTVWYFQKKKKKKKEFFFFLVAERLLTEKEEECKYGHM